MSEDRNVPEPIPAAPESHAPAKPVTPIPNPCQDLADMLPLSPGKWLDQTWLRVIAAIIVEIFLVCIACDRDTDTVHVDQQKGIITFYKNDNSRLIPFIVASSICVVLGACYLRRLYEVHVRVWFRLTLTDILLPIFGLIVMLLIWGQLGRGLGLFHLFWHDNPWLGFWAGFGVGLFWMVLAYLAYLLFVNDLDMQVHTPPPMGLKIEPNRLKQKEEFYKSTDPEAYRVCLIFWLVAPLIVLSLFPVIYSASVKYDRPEQLSFGDGFCRLWSTFMDRFQFGVGILIGVGCIAMILDVWNRLNSNERLKTTVQAKGWRHYWQQFAGGLTDIFAPLAKLLPRIQSWLQEHGLKLSIFATLVLLLSVPFSFKVSLPSIVSALLAWLTLMCWLFYAWACPPEKPKSSDGDSQDDLEKVEVAHWYWRVRLRTRNLFCISAVVIASLHLWFQAVSEFDWSYLLAALSITLLITAFMVGYGWLRFHVRGASLLALGLLFAGCGLMTGVQNYPHRLEDLKHYYDLDSHTHRDKFNPEKHKPSLYHYQELRDFAHQEAENEKAGNGSATKFHALNNEEVLNKWASFVQSNRFAGRSTLGAVAGTTATAPKPPLIIVTSSGGASNSAIFTLNVLLELEQMHPGISRHIRIISGASGGMFGAAYFRSQLDDIRNKKKELGDAPPAGGDTALDRYRDSMSSDFLSPVAQRWAFKDLLMGFCPLPYYDDRGQVLEKVWKDKLGEGIARSFTTMRYEEADGKYPSLIFSPLMVEDGRQILISTLDLDDIVEPERNPGDPDDRIQKLRAVEFFKLFPKAGEFKLSTATRLNCTFPFVAPAATLPATPPRRVVDAGYYDNYGMTVAVSWAYQHRKWLSENTSEVIFLQIRPWYWVYFQDMKQEEIWHQYESILKAVRWLPRPRYNRPVTDIEHAQILRQPKVNWNTGWLSFDEISTPLQGGYESLRSAMIFRNTQQLRLLQQAVPPSESFGGITSYTIVGNLESSMNWYLPHHLVLGIEAVVRKAANENWKPNEKGNPEWYIGKSEFEAAKIWNRLQFRSFVNNPNIRNYFPTPRYVP